MFLITTADQRFWKTDEPILFLGEWCKLFSQRSLWEKLSYEVLPYHWDDRKKLYQDYKYLDKVREQALHRLSESLNQIHGTKHTMRYWRIIIGPWLFYFIQALYDRYQSILQAVQCKKVTSTLIDRYKEGQWLPRDISTLDNWLQNDDTYNHYLYSWIIEYTNRIPFEILEAHISINRSTKRVSNNKIYPFTLKNSLKNFIKFCEKSIPIPDYLNQIVFVSSHFSMLDLARFQLSLRQFPYLFPPYIVSPESKINMNLREKLSYESSGNEFEELLNEMIKEQMPSVYVENYAQMNQTSLSAYPRHPKVILTGHAYNTNEAFKFWAAYHVDCGAKLVGVQYGGHYGTSLCSSTEDHQIRIYDRFYTWGWKSETYENVKPLPAVKFNTIKRNVHPKKDGRLLMVLSAVPRYFYYICSASIASSGTLVYLNDQYHFVRALSKKNKKLLLVRLYLHDYRWSQRERWLDEFPEIECYKGNKSMLDQLKESRLFIGTYNATTYLETFSANFPTIIFWNPNYWELRPSAQPYFEELRRVGILHYTPESAARKVNEISDDSISWWQQSEIQAVKNEFCYQFARTSDNWLKEWKTELRGLK